MIDWSATAAWIALIVAIISPVITAKMGANHQLELKKLELFATRKVNAFEDYLKSVSVLFTENNDSQYFEEYCAANGRIRLYLSPDILEKVNLFHMAIIKMCANGLPPDKKNEIYILWNEITQDLAMQQFISEI